MLLINLVGLLFSLIINDSSHKKTVLNENLRFLNTCAVVDGCDKRTKLILLCHL